MYLGLAAILKKENLKGSHDHMIPRLGGGEGSRQKSQAK